MEAVVLKCVGCGHNEIIPYSTIRTSGVQRSPFGELYIECSECGKNCYAPYHIANGFIIPKVVILPDPVEGDDKKDEANRKVPKKTQPKTPISRKYYEISEI